MYEATIQSPNISRARTVQAQTLRGIKTKAAREFRDEHREDMIVIYDLREPYRPLCVSRRRVGARRWHDAQ